MNRISLMLLLLAAAVAAGCKTSSRPVVPEGLGRRIADGPAREVITAPGGGAIAWLANPMLARDTGARVSDQVYVGEARVAPATGGPVTTLGAGVATLPGTFFFSPTGTHLGALTGWSFPQSHGTLVIADVANGKTRKVAEAVSFFAFSPDGSRLAWVANRTLFLAKVEGGDAVEIAPNVSTLEFSPDGRRMAVRRRAVGGGGELLLVDVEDPQAKRSLADRVADYRWSPDGKRIAFTARNEKGGNDLFLADASGGAPRRIGEGVPAFRFSRGADHLAFLGDVSPQKQFGDLYLLPEGASKPARIGTTVTEFEFSPNGKRIAWLDRYSPQSRGGNLSWADVVAEPQVREIARNVPSFIWSHGGDALAFVYRQTSPAFSIDLHLFRIGKDEKSVPVGRGVFGYSFSADDDRLFFRTECTRNARSCDLHTIEVAHPERPARKLATGIFTYEPDPVDESLLMLTYARTDAEALDVAAVPADGSAPPRTIDRMVAHGTKFVGGEDDRIAYAVLDPARQGVYVADPPEFGPAVAAEEK